MARKRGEIINKITEEFDLHTPEKQVAVTGYLLDHRKQFNELSSKEAERLIGVYEETPGHFNFALKAYEEEQDNLRKSLLASKSANIGSHITDEDTGEVVEITPLFRDEALQVHGQIEGAFWQMATALHRIVEDRLYLALGYTSFRKYCSDTLPFKFRQAYNYALVGEKFGLRLLKDDNSVHSSAQSLESLGIKKLQLIASKAEDQIEKLISEGKIKVDGEDLSEEELTNRKVSELKEMLKNSDKKAQRAELLEEQKKNVEMERDSLAQEKKDLKEWKDKHQERAEQQDEIEAILKRAFNLKREVMREITKLGVDEMFEVATEDQRERLVLFLDAWQKSAITHKNKHIELIEMTNEQQMDIV